MKKVLILMLALIMLLRACGDKQSTQEKLGEVLGVDLSAAEIMSENDTHGGFHGDGETIIQLRVGDISELIKDKPGWHETPMDDELLPFTMRFGEPREGYWYFFDRHHDAEDPYDPEPVNSRFSYNFTFAFYDPENGILNYYKLDT